MKKMLFISVLLFFASNMFANEVDVKGEWKKRRTRSLIIEQDPIPPAVYINNKVVSIYLEDIISNLYISITDNNGNIVYRDNISTNRPRYTYSITLNDLPEGNYLITLSHEYGCLVGWFEICNNTLRRL